MRGLLPLKSWNARVACARADAHAQLVQEKKDIFATCSTTPRKKKLARAQDFSHPPIDFPPFTHAPSSHNTAHKLAGENVNVNFETSENSEICDESHPEQDSTNLDLNFGSVH